MEPGAPWSGRSNWASAQLISNLHDVRRFERIYEEAAVKPRVLQNRFSPQLGPRSASKLPVRVDATSPRPRRS